MYLLIHKKSADPVCNNYKSIICKVNQDSFSKKSKKYMNTKNPVVLAVSFCYTQVNIETSIFIWLYLRIGKIYLFTQKI